MVGIAKYVLKAYPDAEDDIKPPLAPTVHALKLDAATEQMLRRYVKELLAIRTVSHRAAACVRARGGSPTGRHLGAREIARSHRCPRAGGFSGN